MCCGSSSDECIVGATTGYSTLGQLQNKILIGPSVQTEERLGKAQPQKIPYHRTRTTVWRGEPSQHGIGLECAMIDQVRFVIDSVASPLVTLMPGCKRGHDYAGVDRLHRRVCSRVSRTALAVSSGSSISGMATTPLPRFCNVIGVAATSISSRPSPARISRACPGFRWSAWRSDLGTTMRPAESMVVLIP
jgi:hypothetical protein